MIPPEYLLKGLLLRLQQTLRPMPYSQEPSEAVAEIEEANERLAGSCPLEEAGEI